MQPAPSLSSFDSPKFSPGLAVQGPSVSVGVHSMIHSLLTVHYRSRVDWKERPHDPATPPYPSQGSRQTEIEELKLDSFT